MSTSHFRKLDTFFDGSVDAVAIRNYLSLNDTKEIARLAARLAKQQERLDSSALVDAAMDLRVATEVRVMIRREDMVSNMNFQSLFALAEKLGCNDMPSQLRDDAMRSDPLKGPVLRFLDTSLKSKRAIDSVRSQEAIKQILIQIGARTHLPEPQLPCELEPALRYAVNEPAQPFGVLERAFKIFLGFSSLEKEAERRQEREHDVIDKIEQRKQATSENPDEDSLPALQAELQELQTARRYHQGFLPNVIPPRSVSERTEMIFKSCWSMSDSVADKQTLAWLATEFNEFWRLHRPAFINNHRAYVKKQKAISEKKSKGGSSGSSNRIRRERFDQTQAFVRFFENRQDRTTPVSSAVFDFTDSILSDRKARKRLSDFLLTLCNESAHGWMPEKTLQILRERGQKGMDASAVSECLNLIKACLDSR